MKKKTTTKNRTAASPFLKWAGGKGKLLGQYSSLFPKKFNNYFEPFIGGGAVFFYLAPVKARLCDINEELVNCYVQVRDNPDELMGLLTLHRDKHNLINGEKNYYYDVRAYDVEELSPVERAARMIYLNKTCYNGLWRVNSRGLFNVPFGRYKNPGIFNRDNVLAASKALSGTELSVEDFRKVTGKAKKGDFVYFDPPYHPLSATSNFTDYTRLSFGARDQEDLADVFRQLDKAGCHLMLSNSDTPFIRKLYRGFDLNEIMAPRFINSKAKGRKPITELLIRNYT